MYVNHFYSVITYFRIDKILDPKNPKLQENLDTEISIMRDYNHENLVRLYDHFHSSRYIYLVLELCAGGDLSNYIKKSLNNRLDEKSAANFLFQLCSGLKFLHEKNIIHRDLKPANVLLSSADNNAILKLAGNFISLANNATYLINFVN